MWLHPDHPDPRGATLQTVAHRCFDWLTDRLEYPPRLGIFWDYASLYQHPQAKEGRFRTPEEDVLFKQGLGSLHFFYSHPHLFSFRLAEFPQDYPQAYDLPEDYKCAAYTDRGWPFVESCWMGMEKKRHMEDLYHQENRQLDNTAQQHRITPPLAPRKFEKELEHKHFTNDKDDRPMVIQLYKDYFEVFFSNTRELQYTDMGWKDNDLMELSDIVQSGFAPKLQSIVIKGNYLGLKGCHAFATAIKTGAAPLLDSIVFSSNKLGAEGDECVRVLAPALVGIRRLELSNCSMGIVGCQALSDAALQKTEGPNWEHFNIRSNEFGNQGLAILYPIFKTLNLITLNVDQTGLDNEGVEMLVTAILESGNTSRLEEVRMEGNRGTPHTITEEFTTALCNLVQACPVLRHVNVGRAYPGISELEDTLDRCAACCDFRLGPI